MDIAVFKMKPRSFVAFGELSRVVAEYNGIPQHTLTEVTQVAETVDIAIETKHSVIIEKLDLYLDTLSDAQIIFLSFLSDKIKTYRHHNEISTETLKKSHL
jgi:hypothetical protein